VYVIYSRPKPAAFARLVRIRPKDCAVVSIKLRRRCPIFEVDADRRQLRVCVALKHPHCQPGIVLSFLLHRPELNAQQAAIATMTTLSFACTRASSILACQSRTCEANVSDHSQPRFARYGASVLWLTSALSQECNEIMTIGRYLRRCSADVSPEGQVRLEARRHLTAAQRHVTPYHASRR
jgi:hypothetical protein